MLNNEIVFTVMNVGMRLEKRSLDNQHACMGC